MKERKKLLLYRSWHRGCKETDLLLGDFAKTHIDLLSEKELFEYERIVAMDDSALYHLLTSHNDDTNSDLVNKIIKFNQQKELL